MTELHIENFMMLKQLDKYLLHLSNINCFIAGGCFKQLLSGNKPKDIDMFFGSRSGFDKACEKFNKKYTEIYRNEKCIGYYDKENDMTIDLVRSVYGTPEEICGNFDFTVAKFYYKAYIEGQDEFSYELGCHENFFEHLYLKRLVCDDKIPFPISTFERCLRYAKYGFMPCKETKEKLVEAIRQSKDNDVSKSLYSGVD